MTKTLQATKEAPRPAVNMFSSLRPVEPSVHPCSPSTHFGMRVNFAELPISARGITLYRKLAIGDANDGPEQEADRVSEQVMRMPVSADKHAMCGIERSRSGAPIESVPTVRANSSGNRPVAPATEAPPIVDEVLRSPGQPLDATSRFFFEPRFASDFTKVRVHTDERAALSARSVRAAAYSVANHLVFGSGRYSPGTSDGRRLLAHELTHVVQQSAGGSPAMVRRDLSGPSSDPRDAGAGTGDLSGAPPPPAATGIEQFFHGTTWRIAQQLPGNVQAIGGGDFGQGFNTHHDAVPARAEQRARDWGCRLSMNMKQPERYAGVIRFDVKQSDYYRLFTNRKYFGLVSTKQPDYGAKRREWLDFVSGPGRGREASPSFDPAAGAWRHERVNPPPDLGYDLIEGPFYRGVPGLPGTAPPRSAFKLYSEGTVLPQQVVWNHERALNVLNAAPTSLTHYDTQNDCRPVVPPHSVPPLQMSIAEDPRATEAAQRGLTGGP